MSLDHYEAFRTAPALWRSAAIDIARSHSLPHVDLHVFPNGSNLVAALDERLILKIFPPMLRHQFESERASLRLLQGRLAVPTPEIVLQGERDGWPYLVITRLEGWMGDEVWPTLAEEEKERVLRQVGGVIAEVQRIPPGELLQLEPRWDRFIREQIEGCRARHLRLGLSERYLEGLEEYLQDAGTLVPTKVDPVILTGEYIPENFLLRRDADGWRLSGLFDFGDVMTGWGEYDLLGPSTFMAGGMPRRVRSLLRGYGLSDVEIDPSLSRRLMVLFLLHRYSEPNRQIRIDGWQDRAATLLDVQHLLWPL